MTTEFRRDEVTAAIGMCLGRLGIGEGKWVDFSVVAEWGYEFVHVFKNKNMDVNQLTKAIANFTKLKVMKLKKGESLLEAM